MNHGRHPSARTGVKFPDRRRNPVPGTKNPSASPASPACVSAGFDKRIVLCVAGLSPQVITETFYVLATRENTFIPTDVHIITTAEGANRIHLTLLENDPRERHFHRLCDDLGLNPETIRFNADTIHQIGDHEPLDDIRSIGDNETAADAITALVRKLTADPQTAVHASIAGGRKTMGFYLGYAMSLFGREQDRLSHVLVSPPFESHPQFYYPPKEPRVLRDRDNRPIHTRDATITLADIPFVRLRGHLDGSILGEETSYSETVRRAQRNVDPPTLMLDRDHKTIHCGDHAVVLSPSLFAFYAWMARRLLADNPGIHWTQDNVREEYLEEYVRVVGEYSGDYENASLSLRRGMDKDFIDPKVSKINKQIENILGKEPARPYLISTLSVIPESRYRLKGLTLKKQQVRFLKE